MSNLYDFLSNGVNKLKNTFQSNDISYNTGGTPQITPLQMNTDGNLYESIQPIEQRYNPLKKAGQTVANKLLGVQSLPTDFIGLPPAQSWTFNVAASNKPRIGGAIPDMINGFKENYNNGFNVSNLGNNDIDFGRKKGVMYHAGEGLGSIARFGQSPLGRGLLTGAAISLLGGSPAEALTYGATTTAGNQANRMRDSLYRQQLNKQGINTTGLRGYVTDDTYKNLSTTQNNNIKTQNQFLVAMQKDNTSRAKMIMQGLKDGTIEPNVAASMIAAYGITEADFQESNLSKVANSKIALNEAKIEDIKNPKPQINYSYRYGNSTVNHNYNVGNNTHNNKVRIQAPDGTIRLIPKEQESAAIAAGGKKL